jgi:predicted SAM-dependent methyltransferase
MLKALRKRLGLLRRVRKSKILLNRILKEKSDIFLELGSGPKKGKDGWVTLDTSPGCDIIWNLMKGIPFPDNRIAKVFCSHLLEHFNSREIEFLLQECKRVLKPGGEFMIAVPDSGIYINHYIEKKSMDEELFLSYKPAYNFYSYIDYVNYIAYMDGNHKHMFDEENLLAILESIGFKNTRLRDFNPNLDIAKRQHESIYAIAEK